MPVAVAESAGDPLDFLASDGGALPPDVGGPSTQADRSVQEGVSSPNDVRTLEIAQTILHPHTSEIVVSIWRVKREEMEAIIEELAHSGKPELVKAAQILQAKIPDAHEGQQALIGKVTYALMKEVYQAIADSTGGEVAQSPEKRIA